MVNSSSKAASADHTEVAPEHVACDLLVDLHTVCDELENVITKELKKDDSSDPELRLNKRDAARRRQKAAACLMDLLSVEEDLMTIATICGHDDFVGQFMSPKKAKLVGGAARGLKELVDLAPAGGDSAPSTPLSCCSSPRSKRFLPPLSAGKLSTPRSPQTPRTLRAAVLHKAGFDVSDAHAMDAVGETEAECPAVSVLLERVESGITACQAKMWRLGMLGER